MIKIPDSLKDFSVWLNLKNLKSFRKIEIIKLCLNLVQSKTDSLTKKEQNELSSELQNTKSGLAQYALRIYFYQLLKGGKISLDLRQSRFFYDEHWHFKGENLAYTFSDQLRVSLCKTYKSYYGDTNDDIKIYLEEMNVIPKKWSETDKDELVKIFNKHFNQADTSPQNFQLKNLVNSFTDIFTFISDKKGKIPSEFSMLGIYLTSLYMNLDSVGESIDVKECFTYALKVESNLKN